MIRVMKLMPMLKHKRKLNLKLLRQHNLLHRLNQ
jgi:hypothetical protein